MITFPLTPTLNQVYIAGDRQYIFDGRSWSGVAVSIQSLKGDNGIQGPVGPVGPVNPASDKTYTHFQAIASAIWVIAHGLNKHPSVIVIDSSGEECEGLVAYDNLNKVTLTFSAAFGGNAYFN